MLSLKIEKKTGVFHFLIVLPLCPPSPFSSESLFKFPRHYCSEYFFRLIFIFLFHFRLLSGVKKLFIFQLIDGKVTVRNNIIVTHLTHVSYLCLL